MNNRFKNQLFAPASFVLLACMLCVPMPRASAETSEAGTDRTLRAARANTPPLIDGVLNDDCWSACEPARDFFDVARGGSPTQPTTVRVCFDDERIYVAFECYEERMDAVSAAVTQRDAGDMFDVDDAVAVLLDTYHDRRSCYGFGANLSGVKLDLRSAEAGESQEIAWDAVWDVATQRHADKWTAEFAIPIDELRFVPGDSMVWGIEFVRNATPSREVSRWVHREGEVLDPAHYADLTGLSCTNASYGLDVTLSAVGRYDEADVHDYPLEPDDADWDVHPDAGLDVEWVPLPTLTVSATANPDFAQIEGDPNQINLTGDELWLDERRPFFSEGMELFQTPITILYTRRMEDISYGAKAGGRFGTTNLGALYVRSEDLPRTANAEVITDDEGNPLPAIESDYVALALKQDIWGSTTLGGYYAARERADADYSRVAAATFHAPAFEHGRVMAVAARSFNPSGVGADNAYWAGFDYERAHYEFNTEFEWIGEDFAPETGFVEVDRRGRVGGYADIDRNFEIDGETVDEFDVCVYGARYGGIDDGNDYWYGGSILSTTFQNKFNVAVRGEHGHNEVDYPEYPGSTIGMVDLTTNLGAWSGYIFGVSFGDYHNSTYYRGVAVACVQPHERVTVDMQASGVALRDYQDVDWAVERLRADWLISSTSFLRLIAQGEQVRWGMDGGDYRSQSYDLNVLYGWEFSPGSMFYLAYNRPAVREDGVMDYLDPVVVAKVAYFFSL
jgi:hypothetical protein